MYTTHLKKVGDSVILAVPPSMLDMVQLQSGTAVSIRVEHGRLIIEPASSKQYSLQELLAQCDASAPMPDDDHQWTASAPHGRELLGDAVIQTFMRFFISAGPF